MAEFYNLDEAARVLGISAEDLRSKAQRHEIRAFMDAGSWRFKKLDIDEEARRRGMGSNPDLSLSDLDLTTQADSGSGDEFDLSEFQIGAASPDQAPPTMELKNSSDRDILLDDRSVPPMPASGSGSNSTIIGMDPRKGKGKKPSDSDVRLVPDNTKGASDSDVRLGAPLPSDSDVTLASDVVGGKARPPAQPAETDPNATMLQPSPVLGDSAEIQAVGDSGSDFELTPSSVIDALEPESGSDFELTALDASSDEFDATPLRGPGDSDVTGAEPAASGINLGRPSDSGINLQSVSPFAGPEDSIELAPLDDDDKAKPKARPKPKPAAKPAGKEKADLSATALPQKVDLSATALPMKADKDIFEDTDFEVDALDSGSDDQTVQLEAASDFDLEDSDSASEVFALDEEEVDQNAATAMAPAPADVGDDEEDEGFGADPSSAWDVEEPAPASSTSRVMAAPVLASSAAGPEWGGLWVGLLCVTTVFMMLLAFIGMDVVRNMYDFHGDGPASGLIRSLAGMM